MRVMSLMPTDRISVWCIKRNKQIRPQNIQKTEQARSTGEENLKYKTDHKFLENHNHNKKREKTVMKERRKYSQFRVCTETDTAHESGETFWQNT